MATILIAYDIHPTKGEVYDNLIEKIQSLGDWWHQAAEFIRPEVLLCA
jgi:hypothetical protein